MRRDGNGHERVKGNREEEREGRGMEEGSQSDLKGRGKERKGRGDEKGEGKGE